MASSPARLDLIAAHAWQAARKDGLANDFLFQVDGHMERISRAPHRFAIIVADVRRARLKRFPASIPFSQRRHGRLCTHICAAFHASRAPRLWEQRL
jgi:hypothetical protein